MKMMKAEAGHASFTSLLGQTKWWRTRDGRVLRRKKMTLPHKLALLAYMERHLHELEVADALLLLSCPDAPGDVIDSAACRDPERWLRSLPLYKALRNDIIKETR